MEKPHEKAESEFNKQSTEICIQNNKPDKFDGISYHSDLEIFDGPDQAHAWMLLNTNFSLLLIFSKPLLLEKFQKPRPSTTCLNACDRLNFIFFLKLGWSVHRVS